jgi:putative ATP-dependent endonuclease of OLD family
MKLTKFSATNYRSITAAHHISFSNVTVLIGRNNEGKSNLLRALEVAMTTLKQHSQHAQSRPRRFYTAENAYLWQRDFPIQFQQRRPGTGTQTILRPEFLLDEEECLQFKEEIGSTINGSLPLEIRIGKDQVIYVRMVKSGKGTATLSAKSSSIAKFVASRIHFNYIPAVRTDNTTIELVSSLLSQELRTLESDQRYLDALQTIADLQQPILDDLAQKVHGPLKEFLPSIQSVQLEISEYNRRYSLRRDVNVVINDGTPTLLEHKGDGVKSLAALGLLKSQNAPSGASILAIEEPEAHLHPAAIHQVNEIIRSISEASQVIITTHNPLFVDRESIGSNVIVTDGGAKPAKNIAAIREILGIKASDNLTHANYALVVEGEEDRIALLALLPVLSNKIAKALRDNMLIIEPIGGAGNLSYKLSLLRNSLCAYHVLLDGDQAGRNAYSKAEADSLLSMANITFITCRGMSEAEFEDCIDSSIYKDIFLSTFGVNLSSSKFRGGAKWSQHLKATFEDQGKLVDSTIMTKAKYAVAKSVSESPTLALNVHKRSSIDALVSSLERIC